MINQVAAVCFSPAGSTRKAVEAAARRIADGLNVKMNVLDFTLPENQKEKAFDEDTLVVFGTPTYAGRVPNKVLPIIQANFRGSRTPAAAVVTFGNRNYDSSLTELCEVLESLGFIPFAGCAVVSRHVFSKKIAPDRPNDGDLAIVYQFADDAAEILRSETPLKPVVIKNGEPVGPYYTPLGIDGRPAKFLKAKPKIDEERCTQCGVCAEVCPMGSIEGKAPFDVTGICIKCQACVIKCEAGARYFDDPAFLSHVAMLEKNYTRPAKTEFFMMK